MSVLAREWGLMKKMFANGGRWLIIANFYFAAAITVLTVVIVVTQCSSAPFAPLRNPSPQDAQEAIVYPGGVVHVTATKCNDSDKTVVYDISTVWRRQEDRLAVPRTQRTGIVREPGCTTTLFENDIPPDLPLGTWRIEGVEVTHDDGRTQVAGWYTDWIRVEDTDE